MNGSANSNLAGIRVIQAVYGASQGVRDVTGRVQQLVDSGSATFKADNSTLVPPPDKDPAQGHDKHFAMNYTIDSRRFTFACQEGQTVTLRTSVPPPGKIQVVAAAYGAINPKDPGAGSRDVTDIVQQLLDSGVRSFAPTNKLFGDPVDGPRKNFGMAYISSGTRKAVARDEDQTVTVS